MRSAVLKPMPSISRATLYGSVSRICFRLRPVFRDQFDALAGGDAVGLEKNVQLALGAFFIPRLFDRGGAFFADPFDAAQLAGFFAEDSERVGAERIHDFIRVGFAMPDTSPLPRYLRMP